MTTRSKVRFVPTLLASLLVLGAAPWAQEVEAESASEVAKPKPAEPVEPERSPREQAIWVLRSIREPEPPLENPVEELSKVTASTMDDLVSYLRDRKVPALGKQPVQTMSIYQRKLILNALSESAPASILAAGARMLKQSSNLASVATAIELHGVVGQATGLKSIRALLTELPEDEWSTRIEDAIEYAVASILRKDFRGQGDLNASWRAWEPDHLPPVIRGIGTARDPRGLELLNSIMYWEDSSYALLCLAQVRLLGPSGIEYIDKPISDTARELLDSDDDRMRKAALLALGDLRDLECIPRAIEILDKGSDGEKENAVWALQRITGIRLNDQAHTWRTWFGMESRWYARSGQIVAQLDSRDDHEVFEAIRELSLHYLYRDQLAEAIASCLTHSKATVRAAACKALERLNSSVVIPELITRLDDRDERVQLAARKTLLSLTGEERGSEPDDWSDFVGP